MVQSIDSYLQHGDITHVAVFFNSLSQARIDNDALHRDSLHLIYCLLVPFG